MQILSDELKQAEWIEAHNRPILNEGVVEVSINIGDPEANKDAHSESNGEIYISNSAKLVNGAEEKPAPYCTLEQNLWCLDGNRKAIPESDFGNNGYVSDVLSDDTCIFATKIPLITICFKRVFNDVIPGISVTWSSTYDEFADTFSVVAYKQNNVVAEKEISGNKSVKSLVPVDIVGYDSIKIFVKKWCLPNRRARVEEIYVGFQKVYGKSELFDYSHSQSVDPLSTALPKFEIKFSIDNLGEDFNPLNPQGLSKYLMERQEVKSRYGLKMDDGSVEWIKGGTFYLSDWYAKQNGMTADFTARDLLEFMSSIYIDNHDLTSRSLYDLANLVLNEAKLPLNGDGTVKWIIDESLKSKFTNAPLPQDTLANCLQLIANAGCCVLYQDRDGILHIEPLSEVDTDYKINAFNSYSKSEISLSKPIKGVGIVLYKYNQVENKIQFETIENTHIISSVGEIVLIDNPLITYEYNEADFMVESPIGDEVVEWFIAHSKYRTILESSWRADVRLDALDIIRIENSYNTNKVRMTDIEFKYNGAFRGTGKGKVIGNG